MTPSYASVLGLRGSLHFPTVASAALAHNALGDPSERTAIVYAPPGYDDGGSARYPVIYVLHGYSGNAVAALASRPWDENILQRVDRLVVTRAMAPTLLVLVDGFTRLGGSQYVDSIHNGNYARYVTHDVVGAIDAQFRTIACEGGRAVVGKSSGGFGALHLVMEHPGVFCAAGSHSGDSNFRASLYAAFAPAQRTLEAYDFDRAAFVQAFEAEHEHAQSTFVTMEMLAYAAAYSPRSATAFDVDLPFDERSGEIRDDVMSRWRAFDPVERVAARAKELGRLRLRYLDCGRRDEYGLDIGARLIAKRMREAGLDVVHEEFDDGHRNVGYRYDVSLPFLAGVLDT